MIELVNSFGNQDDSKRFCSISLCFFIFCSVSLCALVVNCCRRLCLFVLNCWLGLVVVDVVVVESVRRRRRRRRWRWFELKQILFGCCYLKIDNHFGWWDCGKSSKWRLTINEQWSDRIYQVLDFKEEERKTAWLNSVEKVKRKRKAVLFLSFFFWFSKDIFFEWKV